MGILEALSPRYNYNVEGIIRYLLDYAFTDAKHYKSGVVLKDENLCFIFDIVEDEVEYGSMPSKYGIDPCFDEEDWGLENFDELGMYIPDVIDNDDGTEYRRYSGRWFLMHKKSAGRKLWYSALSQGYVCVLCTSGDDYTGEFLSEIVNDEFDDIQRSYVLDTGASIESSPSLCSRLDSCFRTLYGRDQYLIYPVCNYLKTVNISEIASKVKGYTISKGKLKLARRTRGVYNA